MKSVLKISVIALTFALLASSCAKTFYSVDGKTLAQKHHKSVAVMPSLVSIPSKWANRKVVAEILEKQEEAESRNFQQAIYAWMQKAKSEGKVSVDIQDPEVTNTRLKNAGYPETLITDAQICEILGVDGLIVSNFELYKPFTETQAVAMAVATNQWGLMLLTDEVMGNMGIIDCANKKTIWTYSQKLDGNNPKLIVESFMKKAGKKMPYVK